MNIHTCNQHAYEKRMLSAAVRTEDQSDTERLKQCKYFQLKREIYTGALSGEKQSEEIKKHNHSVGVRST